MLIKGRKFFSAVGLLALCSLFSIPGAQGAEQQITIRIIPAIIQDTVAPGETLEKTLKVTNKSGSEMMMYAYLRDFKAADESGGAELIVPGTETGNYISSWIDISNEGFKFGPGEEREIPFKIKIPANAGPGGYYGAVVFGTQAPKVKPGEAEKGAAVGVAQQTTSLILLQVPGKADERARIREFDTDKDFYSTPFEVKFSTRVENQGNVHFQPVGMIDITNMVGKKVTTIMVNEDRHNVLPNSTRLFENSWKEAFGFGKYEASLSLSYGTPSGSGGEGRKTITTTKFFWVFPAKPVVISIITILILLILFTFSLKAYKKKAIKDAIEQMGGRGRLNGGKNSTSLRGYLNTFLALLGAVLVIVLILYFILF